MAVTGSYGTGRSWLPLVSLPCHCQWDKPLVRLAGWDGTSLFSIYCPCMTLMSKGTHNTQWDSAKYIYQPRRARAGWERQT